MTRRHLPRSAVISALLFALAGCATQASAPPPQTSPTPATPATQVPRAPSRDMLGRCYFSHSSRRGDDLQDRLRRGGVGYLRAGENPAGELFAVSGEGVIYRVS